MQGTSKAEDNAIVIMNGRYCLSEVAYMTFLKMGVDLESYTKECDARILRITEEKDAVVERERKSLASAEVAKTEAVNLCVTSNAETAKVFQKTIDDKDKEIVKYKNPPIYKKNSTWYLLGIISTLGIILAL